jgi:5'-deoxynucleotidase
MTIPKINLQDISRSGHVTRWHSVRTLRNQTLAEHHYMVSMLVNKMAKEIPSEPLSDSERLLLLEYAMWHDTPELLMGDLASPLKRRIEEISGENNPIEAIENEIAPWLTNLRGKINTKPELYIIFKLADMMDAIIFISQEGVGGHSKAVQKKLEASFKKKVDTGRREKPDYNWKIAESILRDLLYTPTNQLEFEIGE